MGRPPPATSPAEGVGEAAAQCSGITGGRGVTGGGVCRHGEVVVQDRAVHKLLLVGYRWREGRGGRGGEGRGEGRAEGRGGEGRGGEGRGEGRRGRGG